MSDHTPAWQCARVTYYDDAKDDLILDCVRPLFDELAATIPRMFFVRHWLRGPHLRLMFWADSEQFRRVVVPAIDARVGAYLAARPSCVALDGAALRPTYEHLARVEQEAGPILPLEPDNTISYPPYQRRYNVFGNDLLADLFDDFYADTNALIFRALDQVRAGASRRMLALDLLLAVGHLPPNSLARSFMSFRSHADIFIVRSADPVATRAAFERVYRAGGAALRQHIAATLDDIATGAPASPLLADWMAALRAYGMRAWPLIRSKSVNLMPGLVGDFPVYTPSEQAKLGHSAFHSTLDRNVPYKTELYANDLFHCFRLVVSLAYLALTRLGIGAAERHLLCYIIASAAEQQFGVSAPDVLRMSPEELARFLTPSATDPVLLDWNAAPARLGGRA